MGTHNVNYESLFAFLKWNYNLSLNIFFLYLDIHVGDIQSNEKYKVSQIDYAF